MKTRTTIMMITIVVAFTIILGASIASETPSPSDATTETVTVEMTAEDAEAEEESSEWGVLNILFWAIAIPVGVVTLLASVIYLVGITCYNMTEGEDQNINLPDENAGDLDNLLRETKKTERRKAERRWREEESSGLTEPRLVDERHIP